MRDQQVTSLRPQIALDSDKSLSSETFQNTVLRPILKFQNELTLKLLTKSKHYEDITKSMELPEQHKFLTTFLTSNKILRNQLIGIVIGMMTESELQFYLTDQKACNKRIIQMQVTRFIDQLNQA